MASWAPGVEVPSPTEPLLASTKKSGVAVPLWPITNIGTFAFTVEVEGSMETKPYGDEVPMPTSGDGAFREPVARIVVPVAVRPARFDWPEMLAVPFTDKLWAGEVVPMPTVPKRAV